MFCSQNLQETTQQIFKRGGAHPLFQSWIRLCEIRNYFISYFLCMIYGLRRVHLIIIINYTIWDMHFQGFHKRRITNFDLLLICKLILQKWIINFINLRYLKTRKCSWTHVRTNKMCAVDIQYVNVFVNMLYRKKIKDKHNIAIEK